MFASYYCTATSTITLPLNIFKRPSQHFNQSSFHLSSKMLEKIHSASGSRSPFCLAMWRNRNGPGTAPERLDFKEWLQTEPLLKRRLWWNMPLAMEAKHGSKMLKLLLNDCQTEYVQEMDWWKVNEFFSNLQALRSSIQPEHIGHPMHLSSSKLYKQVTWTSSTLDILSLLQSWSSGKSFTCQGDDHLGFWTCFPKKDCWFRVLSSF